MEKIKSQENSEEDSEHPFDQSFDSGSDFYEKQSYSEISGIVKKPQEIYSEIIHYKSG